MSFQHDKMPHVGVGLFADAQKKKNLRKGFCVVRQAVGGPSRLDFISTLLQQKPELNKETLQTAGQ